MRTLAGWFNGIVCVVGLVACGFPQPADVASCTPNEFVGCDANVAETCNDGGNALVRQDCGAAGCNAEARRCNQCSPNTDSCGTALNEIDHCGADGLPAGQDMCPIGCSAAPSAHCAYIEPRYLPNICDAVATAASFTVDNAATFDTSLDNNCNGGVIDQATLPQICVARYASIRIPSSGTLTVFGGRALALVADNAVTIDGVLDVGASGFRDGPAGGFVVSGDRVGTNGGGGAGFATAGGAGGSATTDGGGGLGGGKATDPSIVTVLLGGTVPASPTGGGGAGAPSRGGGGGAVTLIACRGQVSVTGTIDAGGGGGQGGKFGVSMFSMFAGAGGGSGGNVVLQGVSVTVTGGMFANGGGGGAGLFHPSQGTPAAGSAGEDGTRSATAAASGGIAFATEGGGGAGGRQGVAPGPGLHPADSSSGLPGGGGGSVGFFQTYTPEGVVPSLAPSAASPNFSTNKTIRTR